MHVLQYRQARFAARIEMLDNDLRTSVWNTVLECTKFLNHQCNLVLFILREVSKTTCYQKVGMACGSKPRSVVDKLFILDTLTKSN